MVSVRSRLSAGLAAAVVTATAGIAAVTPTAPPSISAVSAQVQLTAALAPLLQPLDAPAPAASPRASATADVGGVTESPGDWIINTYNTVVEPWVAYGVELFGWAVEWLPWPIGLLAPQADIIYSGWQPFAQGLVYSFAFLIDGQFDLVLPTLTTGIQTGLNNLVQGEIDWILSFFPPLPPIGMAAAASAATRSAASTRTAVSTEIVAAQPETTSSPAVAAAPEDASTPAVPVQPELASAKDGATPEVTRSTVRPRRSATVPSAAAAVTAPVAKERKASRTADTGANADRSTRAGRAAR
ncbi:MAG: hypothetical protein ACR2JM_13530 [Mycobacterium sp.]